MNSDRNESVAAARVGHGTAMPAAQRRWYANYVRRCYVDIPTFLRLSPRTRERRIEQTTRFYGDLWVLGYRYLRADNLGGRHVNALLELWRHGKDPDGQLVRMPVTRDTAASLWSALQAWSAAIGKHSMVPPFSEVWPKNDPTSELVPSRTRRHGLADVDEATYQLILAYWLETPGKGTLYWLLRAVRELKLQSEEAIGLKPDAWSIKQGHISVRSSSHRLRTIDLDTPEKVDLMWQIHSFVAKSGRRRLGWPLDEVGSNSLADRRFRNAFYYARDHVRAPVPVALAKESHHG